MNDLIGGKVTDTVLHRTGTLLAVGNGMVTVQWHDRRRFVTTFRVVAGRYTLEVK